MKIAVYSAFGIGLMVNTVAQAQEWPTKPIKMIVPFAAGGGTDFVARLVAEHLGNRLGQPVYIENRGGANGAIGMGALKQADPDGYTIAASPDTPLTANPSLQPKLAYKPLEDFIAVAPMVRFPSLIVANPSLKVKTIPELIAAAKANPGGIAYSSSGVGGFSHLAMELFAAQAGVKLLHVPYKGAGPASLGLIANEVQLGVNNVQVTLQNIQAGQLVPIAVGELERISVLPDVPSIAETFPGFKITSWAGIFLPAKTPDAIVNRLQREITAIMQDPKVVEKLKAQQLFPYVLDQAAFLDLVKTDMARWAGVIKSANIALKDNR